MKKGELVNASVEDDINLLNHAIEPRRRIKLDKCKGRKKKGLEGTKGE